MQEVAIDSRREKLALAKKKLKKYRERQASSENLRRSRGEALSRGYSTDSLAESTTSDVRFSSSKSQPGDLIGSPSNFSRPHSSASSLPAGPTNLYHDELRSPFQRVRGTSESSNNGNESKPVQDHEIYYASEQANTNTQPNPLASYFHSPSSSSRNVDESVFAEKTEDSPLNHFQVEPNATQKLLIPDNNEVKRSVIEDDQGSGEATPVIGADYSGYNSAVNSSPEKTLNNGNVAELDSRINSLVIENETLKRNCMEQHQSYQQTLQQLQQLHSHYTQLHAAYSSLAEQQHGNTPATANCVRETDLQAQIQQHLQTMGVLVEERTELQSQLRQAMEIANQKHMENEELQGRLKANRDKIASLEKEANSDGSVKTLLEKTLQKQKAELDKCRNESAQWEAKVIGMQQDRSETLARLKVKARDVDRLQAELGDLRKELHMKEIYIRQLTAAGAQPHVYEEMEATIGHLKSQNSTLLRENQESKAQMEHWKAEAQQSKDNYEVYGRQLNQKIFTLSAQAEKLSEEKMELEGKLKNMEDLRVEEPKSGLEQDKDMELARDHVELMEMHQRLESVSQAYSLLQQQLQAAQEAISERDQALATLKGQFAAKESDVERLREEIADRSQCATDTKGLLEQLQSEKSTVSRAVAQNRELKEQLGELQDKFVHLTQENMELTDRLQSMERQQQLASEKNTTEQSEEVRSLQERLNLVMSESLEKAQLEAEFREKQEKEAELREQLETAQKRIQFLNETNAQLEERCALLKAESHDNVADVVVEQQKDKIRLLEERVGELERENGEVESLREEMEQLRRTLAETRAGYQRFATENSELHHIMAQNAADENQNTIHVELQQALNRITTLSTENDRLRAMAENLERSTNEAFPMVSDRRASTSASSSTNEESPFRNPTTHQQHNSSPHNSDHSFLCQEHQMKDSNQEALESLKTAMEQLQVRFTKAMQEKADLADQNQQMEHLVTQLQYETDTVGEYITMYQHQRRVIRERLRQREDAVAKLSRENEEIQGKLSSLQSLIMQLLDEHGALHPYDQLPPSHAKPRHSSPLIPPRRKSLSQSEMDELAGVEVPIIQNGSPLQTPEKLELSTDSDAQSVGSIGSGSRRRRREADFGAAEQILRILTELKRPELKETLGPSDFKNLHCKYCTGRMMTI